MATSLPCFCILFCTVLFHISASLSQDYDRVNECEQGWISFFSSCLKISDDRLTWPQAADACSTYGAHLFSIDRTSKYLWFDLYRRYRFQKFFIGLVVSPAHEGAYSYRWSDDSPFVYSDWETLNRRCETELCETIVPQWNGGISYHVSWSPASCSSRNRFICEKPKNLNNFEVRLVTGVTPNRGRVEFFLDSAWNRVCMGTNASQTATAVCQHLGYPGVLHVRALNRSGEENSSNYSYMVKCVWNGVISCSFVKATCDLEMFILCRSATYSPVVRLVRLVSYVLNTGTLEVRISGTLMKICSLSPKMSLLLAQASCRHLGYAAGMLTSGAVSNRFSPSVSGFCRENSISKCDIYQPLRVCTKYITVRCSYSLWQGRLVDTVRKTERIEAKVKVNYYGHWSFLCDDTWNINASEVLCQELGYQNAISAKRESSNFNSNSMVWSRLDVFCHGRETALRHCQIVKRFRSCKAAEVVCKEKKYCPSGWFLYADHCYIVSPYVLVSMSADRCDPMNSVSINSPHEQAFVLSLLAGIIDDVSIGLKRGDDGEFRWTNGEPLSYVLWAIGEPNSFHSCVAVNPLDGYWKTVDCFESRSLMCKVPLVDIKNKIRQAEDFSKTGLCRIDELYFKNSCYYWSKDDDQLLSQERAREYCQIRNAELASISTIHENSFIAKETSAVQESLYWIGLFNNHTSESGAFEWLDGSLVNFSKWAIYEPAFKAERTYSCVLFGSNGLEFVWSTSNCTAKAGYVCKRVLNESVGEIATVPDTSVSYVYVCPNGWTKLGTRSCFRRVHAKQTWQDSLTSCEIMSGSLATISSAEEQRRLNSNILDGEEAWIGLNDIFNEGFYVWADGSSLAYVNWSEAEKITFDRSKRDCVAASTFDWKMKICAEKKPSVCYMPAILDYDECYNNTDICHVNATCENTLNSYSCVCKPGYTGNGTTCEDFNECNRSCREQGQHCLNTFGSYECVCLSGWTAISGHCADVNECNISNICHSRAICINNDGSYQCECLPNWTGNGTVCVDVNECEIENPCHSKATCTNDEGAFLCTCQPGWTGNGIYCDDVNECEIEGSCHSQASCTNQGGSYSCMCLPGWSGDGYFCNDTNECLSPEICPSLTSCRNTNGSFECLCSSGDKGDGLDCEGVEITSKPQWKVTLIVISLVTLVVSVVIALIVYARRRFRRLRGSFFGSDFVEPPDEWEVSSGDMTLLEKLGDGFFGVVHRAYLYRSPSRNSSKRVENENTSFGNEKIESKEEFLEEIALMKRIGQHSHIVSLLACITTSEPFCLVVEYCELGDLLNYLRKRRPNCAHEQQSNESASYPDSDVESNTPSLSLDHDTDSQNEFETNESINKVEDSVDGRSENQSSDICLDLKSSDFLSFVWQISSGMEYLAGKGLVHRDLACRNVLVCENKLLKVSDFGLTRSVYQDGVYSQKTTRRLPLRWMSIEAMTDRQFSEQSDVWSFGVVMWEIFTLGSIPYPCISSEKLLSHLCKGNRLTPPENCSTELYRTMSACWHTDPVKRPVFCSLTQHLGKLLETEQQSEYIVFDAASSDSSWDLESLSKRSDTEDGETCELKYVPQKKNCGKGLQARYVAGSAYMQGAAKEIINT